MIKAPHGTCCFHLTLTTALVLRAQLGLQWEACKGALPVVLATCLVAASVCFRTWLPPPPLPCFPSWGFLNKCG